MIDIEKCLTAAQKKQAKQEMNAYVYSELRQLIADIAEKEAVTYFKANEEEIRKNIHEELDKELPRIVKGLLKTTRDELRDSFRSW